MKGGNVSNDSAEAHLEQRQVTAEIWMLQDGLFFISIIIFFSCVTLVIATIGRSRDLSLSAPHLVDLYICVLIVSLSSAGWGLFIALCRPLVPPDRFLPRLTNVTVFLSILAMGSYVFVLMAFGFLILAARISLSHSLDLGLGSAFIALLAVFFLVLLVSSLVYKRRSDRDDTGISEAEMVSAADWGAIISIVLYAVGAGLQCLDLIFGNTGVARTVACHATIIIFIVHWRSRMRHH